MDARGSRGNLPGRGWNLEVHRDEHFRFLLVFRGGSIRVIMFVEIGNGPPLVLRQAFSFVGCAVLLALSGIGWVALLGGGHFCDPTDQSFGLG